MTTRGHHGLLLAASAGPTPAVVYTQSWIAGASATSHPVTLPSSIVAGDLLLMAFTVRPTLVGTVTKPSGWSDLNNQAQATNTQTYWWYKIADGSEGSTATVSITSSNNNIAAHTYRIPAANWHGTTPPESAMANNATTTPDSPNLAPSWGAISTIYLVTYGSRSDSSPLSYPYPNGNSNAVSLGSTGGSGTRSESATCWTDSAAGSLDPAAFSMVNTRAWVASTVAIRGP